MTKRDLLNTLDELRDEEFECFKFHLEDQHLEDIDLKVIPKSKLQNATRCRTVDLMIQNYTLGGAVEVMKDVLGKIQRNDLVESLESEDDDDDDD